MNAQQKRELGSRVQRLMDEQGLTNERLAYRAGVSSKTVSRVLNAKHELRLGTIEKLAEALKVSEAELRGPPPAPLGLGAASQNGDGQLAEVLELLRRLDERLTVAEQDRSDAQAETLRRAAAILTQLDGIEAAIQAIDARRRRTA